MQVSYQYPIYFGIDNKTLHVRDMTRNLKICKPYLQFFDNYSDIG